MESGIIFDIREFALHDGPGIRTTVFLKGCPLACQWCHNPEGQSFLPEKMESPSGSRIVGRTYSSAELAGLLLGQKAILDANEGGVTFSGGEPIAQARFITEVIDQLEGMHVLLDTSGCGNKNDFKMLLSRVDLVYFDLKLIDPEKHRFFTGLSNELILTNLQLLNASGVPFIIRVPLVPGVTDLDENLEAVAQTVGGLAGMVQVDLLPYNKAAGAKYKAVGKTFLLDIDANQMVNANTAIFERYGIKVMIR
jgi:pyruvate formate lyase activating enzyme